MRLTTNHHHQLPALDAPRPRRRHDDDDDDDDDADGGEWCSLPLTSDGRPHSVCSHSYDVPCPPVTRSRQHQFYC